tara:strand:+ start:1224 stop:1415 length:192 start_codon:yes stop_codon:yes gene_type:complete
MKILRLTEKPSNNQIYVNMGNVNWYYTMVNDDGQCTKMEFEKYNVLVHESPEEIQARLDEADA